MTESRLSNIFSAFSDVGTLKMFETISQHLTIHRSDFGTRKKYYSRLMKLKDNSLVRKKKNRYVVTAFGSVVYNAFLHARKAQDLYWQLRVIDSFNETIPEDQRKDMIE